MNSGQKFIERVKAEAEYLQTQRCWFFHRWQKWRETETGQLKVRRLCEEDYRLVGQYAIYKRVCIRCGKPQMKRLETKIGGL